MAERGAVSTGRPGLPQVERLAFVPVARTPVCSLSLGEDNDCFWPEHGDAALATPIRRRGYG
jgi:hypothetical protein